MTILKAFSGLVKRLGKARLANKAVSRQQASEHFSNQDSDSGITILG